MAAKIIASLDADPDLEAAWEVEVRDRLEGYRRGAIGTVYADEVMARGRRAVLSSAEGAPDSHQR